MMAFDSFQKMPGLSTYILALFFPSSLLVYFTVYLSFRRLFSVSRLAVLFSYTLDILKGNNPIYVTERKVKLIVILLTDVLVLAFSFPTSPGIIKHCCVTLLPKTDPDCVS